MRACCRDCTVGVFSKNRSTAIFVSCNKCILIQVRNVDSRSFIKEKYKVARNEKQTKKLGTWIFVFQKYSKFCSFSIGHYIKHKPLISEEWVLSTR